MIKRNNNKRLRSKTKIRNKISGTQETPRLTVYRSLNNIYAQIIDDTTGKTLVAASSLSKEIAEDLKTTKGKAAKSKLVGNLVASKAIEQKISSVVFDRNGYRYHGRIQAVAEGAREKGLKFYCRTCFLMPGRLMAGLRPLEASAEVRVLSRQQIII